MKKFCFISFLISGLYSSISISQYQTLPVELVNFESAIDSSGILLSWETATEVDNAGFDVQRYFNNKWEVLTFIPGAGTSNSPKYYYYTDTTAVKGNIYLYRLKQIDNVGDYKYSDTLTVPFVTSIKRNRDSLPDEFILYQNYPNPFSAGGGSAYGGNPTTAISYQLSDFSHVTLKLYDTLGRKVATLVNKDQQAGMHSFQLSANSYQLSSGIYFYRLKAIDKSGEVFIAVKKLELVK